MKLKYVLAIVPVLIMQGAAAAQSADSLAAAITSIDQQVRVANRSVEIIKEEQTVRDTTAAKVNAGSGGLSIQSSKGDFVLKFKGLVQTYVYHYGADKVNAYTDNITLRRARLSIEGSLGSLIDFKIQPELAGAAPRILDAYGDFKIAPAFGIRAGKFKPSVGIEGQQSPARYLLADAALPTAFTPTRDIGIQLQGTIGGGILDYQIGAFNGAADGVNSDADISDGKAVAGRLTLQPFVKLPSPILSGLSAGFSGSFSNKDKDAGGTTSLPSYKTAGGTKFFSYVVGRKDTVAGVPLLDTATAKGDFIRIAPVLTWYAGPVSLVGEYIRSTQSVSSRTRSNRHGEYTHQAWQAAAGWVITGEDASYKGFKTAKPFNLKKHTFGSLELSGRINGVSIDAGAFDDKLADQNKSALKVLAWGGGLNWYPVNNLRWTLDFEQSKFIARGGSKYSRSNENLVTIAAVTSF